MPQQVAIKNLIDGSNKRTRYSTKQRDNKSFGMSEKTHSEVTKNQKADNSAPD
ncbi:hypothetical protein D3C71_1399010 [compost metagenome]